MNHTIQECPEQNVREKSVENVVCQQYFSLPKIFFPVFPKAGFVEYH